MSRESSELRDYWQFMARWWRFFLLVLGCAAIGAYVVCRLIAPTYQATATLVVGESLRSGEASESDVLASVRLARTYAELVDRPSILQASIDALQLPLAWRELQRAVSVDLVRDTQIIRVSVLDRSPERAQAIANDIAWQLTASQTGAEADRRRDFVAAQLHELDTKMADAGARLSELERTAAAGPGTLEAKDANAEAETLRGQIASWTDRYARLRGLDPEPAPGALSVIEPAELPAVPARPRTAQNVLLAAVLALLAAGVGALLSEHLDDHLVSPDQIGDALGLATLGTVPPPNARAAARLVAEPGALRPYAPIAGRVLLAGVEVADGAPTFCVAAAGDEEAGSATAANLATALAQSGKQVILVDANLRRPRQHARFGVPNEAGLIAALAAAEGLPDGALVETSVGGLRLMPAGPAIADPSGLFAWPRVCEILGSLRGQADAVVVDCPPVAADAGAVLLARRADVTVLVVEAGMTSLGDARAAVEMLRQSGANVVGAVLIERRGWLPAPVARLLGRRSPA